MSNSEHRGKVKRFKGKESDFVDHEKVQTEYIEPSTLPGDNEKVRGGTAKSSNGGGTFQKMGLLLPLLKAVQRKGFKLPTPIQRKCIPPLLSGRDVVGMARTGSGKTVAFVLPLLQALRIHSVKVGVRGLILSPSRELALQTFLVTKELSKLTDLRIACLVGGDSFEEQFAQLAANPDIIIATPGRLMHICVETKMSLQQVQFIIWDEADRLMEDVTMSQQMIEITARLPEARQTALFSATLPKALAEFASVGLKNPVLIRLDTESKLSPDLRLAFIHVQSDAKDSILLILLDQILKKDRKQLTVIFVATKHHVEYLQELLSSFNFPCTYIYGSLDQMARKISIENFRSGKCPILIVTDVAARGIDVPLLDNVINYDFPSSPKLFVHRVGRVARAGRHGRSFSLVSPDEMAFLFDLQLFLGHSIAPAISGGAGAGDTVAGAEATITTTTTISSKDGMTNAANVEEKIFLGVAPQHLIDEEEESITAKFSISGTLSDLKSVMQNACKLYRRTRLTASPESHRRVKEFLENNPILGIHPIFLPLMGKDAQAQVSLVRAIQQFKPKSSHLSLHKPTERLKSNNHSNSNSNSSNDKMSRSVKDDSHYLKYTKEGAQDDAGYSLTNGGNFAEQARQAAFDLNGNDDSSIMKRRRNREDDSRRKLFKTEFGTKVPTSFRTDVYEKWRAKTHLDIQRPGEIESEAASARAKSIISIGQERKRWRGKKKPPQKKNNRSR